MGFKNWLSDDDFLKKIGFGTNKKRRDSNGLDEMSKMGFGQHRDKEIQWDIPSDTGHVPTPYLQWAHGNANSRQAQAKRAEIEAELARREKGGGANTPTPANPTPQPEPQRPKAAGGGFSNTWIAAKLKKPRPDLGLDPSWEAAGGHYVAMKEKPGDPSQWMFILLDVPEKRLVQSGLIPKAELKATVESVKDEGGQLIKRPKPSQIISALLEGGIVVPDKSFVPSQEQTDVDEKFAEIMAGEDQNHMVINALAGSGKTTTLRELAKKHGKMGQKWLYLVFNSKNREEAKEDFPPWVQVETTNSFCGREVLGKNLLKPTDRIVDVHYSDKSRLIADGPGFAKIMSDLNLPDPNEHYGNDPKRLGRTEKTLWWTLSGARHEFKMEAVKLLDLAKSYSVDPRGEDEGAIAEAVGKVLASYDMNTVLEKTKEKLEKQAPWANEYISDLMGVDFMTRDFTEELQQATIWLLRESMPHASEQEFEATTGQGKGNKLQLGKYRDFNDDLWYSAIHAEELNWPQYDIVLADEVQDFNHAQKVVLQKLAEQGARIVAVGDPNQGIYRFRGADADAFGNLTQMLTDISANQSNVEMPLTGNFRSRKNVLDFTNAEGKEAGHVSNLQQGKEWNRPGEATKYEKGYEDAFDDLKQEWDDWGETRNTAFLARTNEPLVHASLQLLKLGIPFVILGKDIAKDLLDHIDRIQRLNFQRDDDDVWELSQAISTYLKEKQEKNANKAAKAAQLKELKETTEAMVSAIEQFAEDVSNGSIGQFKKWLKEKFGGLDIDAGGKKGKSAREAAKAATVTLSTVHKSKGLQFERVYILRDDLWPHPRSTRPEDLAQELNNKYIGRTRAEDSLHVLDLEGQPGYKGTGGEDQYEDRPRREPQW